MEKNNGTIESRFETPLNLVNFCIMKNSSNKNPFFSKYILNTYYPNIISTFDECTQNNLKSTQTDVKTYDIGIQCNLENTDSNNILRTKIVEDEWFFIKDKDI
tara:strand:+ start:643 stop:951 length:309 start_codon:yes stop_codon:yes gene_type:complete